MDAWLLWATPWRKRALCSPSHGEVEPAKEKDAEMLQAGDKHWREKILTTVDVSIQATRDTPGGLREVKLSIVVLLLSSPTDH